MTATMNMTAPSNSPVAFSSVRGQIFCDHGMGQDGSNVGPDDPHDVQLGSDKSASLGAASFRAVLMGMSGAIALLPQDVSALARNIPVGYGSFWTQPALFGPTTHVERGEDYSEYLIEVLEELRELGQPTKVRRAVTLIYGDWDEVFGRRPIVEDLGDGSVLFQVLPSDEGAGVSLEILVDGRIVYNISDDEGNSLDCDIIASDSINTAVQTIIQAAFRAGISIRA